MPRTGRLHIVGGCYHLMGRGGEGRRNIFACDEDKKDFIERLASGLEKTEAACLAWVMMSNHYHLLIRAGKQPLSDLMRNLLGGYAGSYNRRHKRAGYVFQNRFKSILCDEESYLLTLIRYIHLNPLRAKVLDSLTGLDRYRWTGHSVLMGKRHRHWQLTDVLLERFGSTVATARRQYRAFIAEGFDQRDRVDYSGGELIRSYGKWQDLNQARREHERRIGDERILGDSDFVLRSLKQDCLDIDAQSRRLRAGWDLPRLIEVVCRRFDVEVARISDKGRRNNLAVARAVICYLGTLELGLTASAIGSALQISSSAVSRSCERGRKYCAEYGLAVDDLG